MDTLVGVCTKWFSASLAVWSWSIKNKRKERKEKKRKKKEKKEKKEIFEFQLKHNIYLTLP